MEGGYGVQYTSQQRHDVRDRAVRKDISIRSCWELSGRTRKTIRRDSPVDGHLGHGFGRRDRRRRVGGPRRAAVAVFVARERPSECGAGEDETRLTRLVSTPRPDVVVAAAAGAASVVASAGYSSLMVDSVIDG